MNESVSKNKSEIIGRLIYSIFFVVAVVFLVAVIVTHKSDSIYGGESLDYSSTWSYESGAPVDFNHITIDGKTTIRKRTNGDVINTKDLCFYTKNIYFSVYLNSELIYDFHPVGNKFYGKAYGVYPHSITLPVMAHDGTLYIVLENVYPDETGFIKDIKLDDGNEFVIEELQKSVLVFILCLIGFVFGIILTIIGLVGHHFGEKRFEIVSLAAFSLISSIWIASETSILSMLSGSPVTVHFTDYIALDLIPLAGLIYISSATGIKNKVPAIISVLSTTFVIVYSVVSTVMGNDDYHQLLWLTHINLAFIAALVLIIVVYSIVKKRFTKRLVYVLLSAVFIVLITGTIDIVRYNVSPTEFARVSYFKYSIFVFILLIGIYEFVIISEMSRRGKYAEIMEQLAYRDGLTNLLNRKGYNEALQEASRDNHKYTFIIFDLNYLKKVNDELGHNTGDVYIKQTAQSMSETFNKDESCYRIGGDEFFVLAGYGMDDPRFKEKLDSFQSKLDEFNEKNKYSIPLCTAYGAAEFDPQKDDIETISKLSDQRMYKMKAEMKAVRE